MPLWAGSELGELLKQRSSQRPCTLRSLASQAAGFLPRLILICSWALGGLIKTAGEPK